MALLEVPNLEKNVAFDVRCFAPPRLNFDFSDMNGLLESSPERSDQPVPDSVHQYSQYTQHHLTTTP